MTEDEKPKRTKPKVNADAMCDDTGVSEFEYLKAKVMALEEATGLMQNILNQNNLTFEEKSNATDVDLEDRTWRLLEELE